MALNLSQILYISFPERFSFLFLYKISFCGHTINRMVHFTSVQRRTFYVFVGPYCADRRDYWRRQLGLHRPVQPGSGSILLRRHTFPGQPRDLLCCGSGWSVVHIASVSLQNGLMCICATGCSAYGRSNLFLSCFSPQNLA